MLFVDDLLIVSNSETAIEKLKVLLTEKFEMTDMGKLAYFLGLSITQDVSSGTLTISQKKAIESMLEELGMSDCKPIKTPLEPMIQLKKWTNECEKVNHPYRELIGTLMYIMLGSRPDLCFAVGYLSRFQELPTEEHWKSLKHVLSYKEREILIWFMSVI